MLRTSPSAEWRRPRNAEKKTDGAVAAVEVAALKRAPPPGAGRTTLTRLRGDALAARARASARGRRRRGGRCREKAEAFESAPTAPPPRRAARGLGGDAWFVSAARELQRSKAALTRVSASEQGPAPQPPSRSLPSLEAARASLLGGFGVELLSRAETASAQGARDGNDAFGTSAAPLVAVGSAIPLPPLPYWLLAPCSPKSSVAGWGAEGAASALALLLALESSGSLVTRDLPADAKLASVSGTFCLGREVWTHAGVAAAAAALTDLYWDRLGTELSSSAVNPRVGSSAYGFAGDAKPYERGVAERLGATEAKAAIVDDARAVSAARLSEALCDTFADESFGDRLFARHVALQLRAGAPARARRRLNAPATGWRSTCPPSRRSRRGRSGGRGTVPPPGGAGSGCSSHPALESGALDRCPLEHLETETETETETGTRKR